MGRAALRVTSIRSPIVLGCALLFSFALAMPAIAQPEISVSPDELIFSGVMGTTSAAQSIMIEDIGTSDLIVKGVSIVGADATDFALVSPPAAPFLVTPSSPVSIDIIFSPELNSLGSLSAFLRIESHDADEPLVDIGLYGLSANGLEGSNEPPLHNVVTTLGFAIDVGGTQLALGTDPNPIGDEVIMPVFQKAGPGSITIVPVARYSPAFVLPFGWYVPNGATPILNEVGVLSGSSDPPEHQTLFPELASGTTLFDPGSQIFGVYTSSPSHNAYTQDSLNALLHPSNVEHAARVYPLKDRDGVSIPNAFLVGFEEASNGDYQDYDFAIFNVVEGQVPAEFTVAPNSINYGSWNLGETSPPVTVTLTNTLGDDVTVDQMTLTGIAGADFQFAGPATPFVVAGNGGVETINIAFSPTQDGLRFATLNFVSPDLPMDPTVSLSGNGGTGNRLLFVVPDSANVNPQDQARSALFAGFGYAVTTINETDTQAAYDAAVAENDVAYITETVTSANVNTKLTNAPIGVVSEDGFLNDDLDLASTEGTSYTGSQIEIVDNGHYITIPFELGVLTMLSAAADIRQIEGTLAPALEVFALRTVNSTPTFAILETGDQLLGGGLAAGRRVILPWGDADFDMGLLTGKARTLLERALEWASGQCNPTISEHPQNASVCEGDPVSFSVAIGGIEPLTIAWRKNGLLIPGESARSLTIESTGPADAGTYDAVVTNPCGTTLSAPATLTVHAFQPADIDASGIADGNDIPLFVPRLLNGPAGPIDASHCAADMDGSGLVDVDDVAPFVQTLLAN